MLSYKNWKSYKYPSEQKCNESVGATFVLGVKQPQNIGTVGSTGASEDLTDFDIALEEAKKKLKKKMDGEMGPEPEPKEPVEKEPVEKEPVEKEPEDKEPSEEPEDKEKVEKKPPEDASPEEGGDDGEETPTLFQKKKQKSKMKKEDVEFWTSLQKMLHGGLPGEKFKDGTNGFTEDALLAPIDPNKGVIEDPQPGEVGYAPQTRIGEF
jgi:outer membrane biosynthesis protein TonB